jgi:outer membrane receptor protein involved in Fe transport
MSIESGANNGTFGYYINMHDFSEDGWRDLSESDATNIYASFGFRNLSSTLDLSIQHGKSDLFGNGSSPAELLATDRDAVFTAPDITRNDMNAVTLEGTHWLRDTMQLSGNVFWRKIKTDSFNGDGSEFVVCDDGSVIEGDNFNDINSDDECQAPGEIIDPTEVLLSVTPGDDFDAINNISSRTQQSYGGSVQSTFLGNLFDRENQLIVGLAFRQGLSSFRSRTELAVFDARRSTDPAVAGPAVPDETNDVKTRTRSSSLYITDTLSLTDEIALTLAGRYDNTRVKLGDLTGTNPRLNGENDYERFNPSAGLTWQFNDVVNIYGNYSESSRAPTAIELACTEESLEPGQEGCRLPNAFLADPPLDQVVARGFDAGFRGKLQGVNYHLGAFHTTNSDDIIFISRGGASGNVGVFDNVGDTRRVGMESAFSGSVGNIDWFANYSFVDATFQDNFVVTSPNHPIWSSDPGNARLVDLDGDNTLDPAVDGMQVRAGDRIPGIPQHTLKIGGDYWFNDALSLGIDMVYNSDQYFRGDEANQDGTVNGFVVFNLRARYQVNDHVSLFTRVDNLFNNDYESFGLYGEANEITGFEAFTNQRFLGAGAPIGIWMGMKVAL